MGNVLLMAMTQSPVHAENAEPRGEPPPAWPTQPCISVCLLEPLGPPCYHPPTYSTASLPGQLAIQPPTPHLKPFSSAFQPIPPHTSCPVPLTCDRHQHKLLRRMPLGGVAPVAAQLGGQAPAQARPRGRAVCAVAGRQALPRGRGLWLPCRGRAEWHQYVQGRPGGPGIVLNAEQLGVGVRGGRRQPGGAWAGDDAAGRPGEIACRRWVGRVGRGGRRAAKHMKD